MIETENFLMTVSDLFFSYILSGILNIRKPPIICRGFYIKESKIREYKVMYERIKEISPFFRRQRLEQRHPEQDNNNRLLHVFQIPLLPVPGNEDSQTARLLLQPVPFQQ